MCKDTPVTDTFSIDWPHGWTHINHPNLPTFIVSITPVQNNCASLLYSNMNTPIIYTEQELKTYFRNKPAPKRKAWRVTWFYKNAQVLYSASDTFLSESEARREQAHRITYIEHYSEVRLEEIEVDG